MLDRIPLSNLHQTLLKAMGVPPLKSLRNLDERLNALEKHILDWEKQVRKTPKLSKTVHKRVLLADTEPANFDTVRKMLPRDIELRMVRDWDQLFKETRKAEVPLIIIDLTLLGSEGIYHIKKLKAEHPKLRMVALASYLSETLAQAMPEGLELSGILQKPLDAALLKESLNKYLA